jgi:S1-C subfamily serine protease
MIAYCRFAVLVIFACIPFQVEAGSHFQATQQSPPDTGARFRVTRSICGSKGSQQRGRFMIEDPRSVFSIPQDRQVIVYFELEGPLGMHRIEGLWKSPSGKIATISDFNYESRERRFSANWTLALSESAETGTWTLEAHIDGEYVGAFTFQIVANASPADTAPKKRLLSPAETYQRLLASTVMIEKMGKGGVLLGIHTGFIVSPTVLLSSFQTVDGASKTRVIYPDGRAQETDQLLAWNRNQDWAAIKIEAGQAPALPFAPEKSWDIGDPVSYLDVAPQGNRVLSEVKIIGKNTFPTAGDRLNLSNSMTAKAVGAPLLNVYGEVVGILEGGLNPGINQGNSNEVYLLDGFQPTDRTSGGMAVPVSMVNLTQTTPYAMENLIRDGVSFPPLVAGRHVSYIQFTHRIDRSSGNPWPADYATQFSRRDGKMAIFVTWDPKAEIKGLVSFQIYSRDNKPLVLSQKIKDAKVGLKPGKRVATCWQIDISDVPVGIYRVDVLLNDEPASRAFFRIVN